MDPTRAWLTTPLRIPPPGKQPPPRIPPPARPHSAVIPRRVSRRPPAPTQPGFPAQRAHVAPARLPAAIPRRPANNRRRGSRATARPSPPSHDSPPNARGSRARRARPAASRDSPQMPLPTRAIAARTSHRHAAPYAHARRAWPRAIRQPTPRSRHQLVPLLKPLFNPE
jgi:hypothetical protein